MRVCVWGVASPALWAELAWSPRGRGRQAARLAVGVTASSGAAGSVECSTHAWQLAPFPPVPCLQGAQFENAILSSASFGQYQGKWANLKGAHFEGALLSSSDVIRICEVGNPHCLTAHQRLVLPCHSLAGAPCPVSVLRTSRPVGWLSQPLRRLLPAPCAPQGCHLSPAPAPDHARPCSLLAPAPSAAPAPALLPPAEPHVGRLHPQGRAGLPQQPSLTSPSMLLPQQASNRVRRTRLCCSGACPLYSVDDLPRRPMACCTMAPWHHGSVTQPQPSVPAQPGLF